MAGVKALRRLQLGKESVPGTPVAATAIWRGLGVLEDQREVQFAEETVGKLFPPARAFQTKLLAGLEMEETPATFEQLPYVLAASVDGVTIGTQDGTGSDYIYTYAFPDASVPLIKTFTIEGGDNQQAEKAEYAFVQAFTLSGESSGVLSVSATWVARQVTPTTFTSGLSLVNVEEILFGTGKLYIDTPGSIGSTLKSNTLRGMSFEYQSGIKEKFTIDGLYFAFHQFTQPSFSLQLTFEHDSTAVAEIAAWRAGTPRAIRLKWEGSSVTTPGSVYSKKTLILDLYGVWESFEKLSEQDGNDIVTGTLHCDNNLTAGTAGSIVVVNEVASLP